MRIAITGSSGLIGSALRRHLEALHHEVIPIVRRAPERGEIGWDPAGGRLAATELGGVDAVIHLAAAGIGDRRWTDRYKRTLRESRVAGTTLVAEAIAAASEGPAVLLSASAVGYYGARGDEELDESSARGDGFLAEVVEAWEASTAPAGTAGVRVVHLRSGVVLTPDGGALKRQLPLFKLGLGGKMGSGRQWLSWISIDDHVAAVTHLLTAEVAGAVNLTAPHPVTNADFTETLGDVLHRPTFLPIPRFGPRLLLGAELAENLVFTGQKVLPKHLLGDPSFEFRHPRLESALRALLDR